MFLYGSHDSDYILEQGDVLFKNINILRPLSVEELPETVRIGDHVIKVEMLANINRLLGARNMFEKHTDVLPDIGNGLTFTTHGYCFSLIWAKQNVYFFLLLVEIKMNNLLLVVVLHFFPLKHYRMLKIT